jgi:hypothetical protein
MSKLVRLAFGDTIGTNLALLDMYDAPCGPISPTTGVGANGTRNGSATSTSTSTSSGSTAMVSSGNAISVSSSSLMIVAFTILALA